MKTTGLVESLRIFPGIAEIPEVGFEVKTGRRRKDMRELLADEVFAGRPIRWKEAKGWFSSVFTVVGPSQHVRQVKERIDCWAAVVGQMETM